VPSDGALIEFPLPACAGTDVRRLQLILLVVALEERAGKKWLGGRATERVRYCAQLMDTMLAQLDIEPAVWTPLAHLTAVRQGRRALEADLGSSQVRGRGTHAHARTRAHTHIHARTHALPAAH
jgi:hypothetical protein